MSIIDQRVGATTDEVASRIEIAELSAKYCRSLDQRDLDGFVALWSADGVWSLPFANFQGHAEIRSGLEGLLQGYRATRHLAGNLIVSFMGNKATASSYCYANTILADGTPMALWAEWDDELTVEAGQWRFLRRTISFTFDSAPTEEE